MQYKMCYIDFKYNTHTHTHIYIHTYLLTPWCRVLLEKLTGLQLVKTFPAFHGTRRFITALRSLRHLSLSRASRIQSIYPHRTSWRSIHPSTPRSPQWSLSLRFIYIYIYSSISDRRYTHLFHFNIKKAS